MRERETETERQRQRDRTFAFAYAAYQSLGFLVIFLVQFTTERTFPIILQQHTWFNRSLNLVKVG